MGRAGRYACTLVELIAQTRRYVVVQDDVAIAVSLWVMFAWVQRLRCTPPLLIATSAEPDSGKSTLLGVLGFLVPRPYSAVELTGANIYHIVDRLIRRFSSMKPTNFFAANPHWLRSSTLAGRGARQNSPPGAWRHSRVRSVLSEGHRHAWPDTGATASRAIVCMLWPKLPSEQVADFRHVDDDDFTTLRRKLMRWAADTAVLLKDRIRSCLLASATGLAANWCLLLAIADVAGGLLPKRARAAAAKFAQAPPTVRAPQTARRPASDLR